jgi:hypothetical protein
MDDPLTPANDTIVRGDVLPGGAAGEVPMADNMSQISATANAHMRRDIEAGGKWTCQCEACRELRSLIGMERVLEVRPLVREIEQTEKRLKPLPDGLERQSLLEHYLKLHDRLAEVMAK